MRFHHLLFLLAIAACSQAPGAGTLGNPCRWGWTHALCDDGLRCVDDVCHACGGVGEMCCSIPGGPLDCPGLSCLDVGPHGTCSGECGLIGLACCIDETCPGSGDCNSATGMCEGTVGDPCFSGDVPFPIQTISPECGPPVVTTFKVSSQAEAEQCAAQHAAALPQGFTVCELGVPATDTVACSNGVIDTITLSHCDEAHLAACTSFWCPDCPWSIGPCP